MNKRMCVIAFADESLLAVCVKNLKTGEIEQSQYISKEALPDFITSYRLCGVTTTAILHQNDYQLFKTKAPNVSDKDVADTILWQEQSRFSVPINQLVIETTPCASVDEKEEASLQVVSVVKSHLQQCYDLLDAAMLNVKKITIPEFCYESYLNANHDGAEAVVVIRVYKHVSQALFFYENQLIDSLRLPSVTQEEVLSGEIITTAKRFYDEKIAPRIQAEPLWLFESPLQVADEVLAKVEKIRIQDAVSLDSALMSALLEATYVK